MKILVTGATGCLGGVAARKLAALGHAVTGLGRDAAKGADLERSAIRFDSVDLGDAPAMRRHVAGNDVVIHCGGFSSAWGSKAAFQRANVEGTAIILRACEHSRTRLVFVSSPSIYFDFADRLQVTEDQAPARTPVNAYAASKIQAEALIVAVAQRGLDAVILRPRAIFGETDTALLPRLLRVARRGYLPLIDGGRAIVDLTYVENAADALIAAAIRPQGFSGEAFNISNGEPVAIRDLFARIAHGLGLQVRTISIPFRFAYLSSAALEFAAMLRPARPEPSLTRYTVGVLGKSQTLSIEAARRELGFNPAVSLSDGIDRTIAAWSLSHA
ncbi:MAG TPA: NAD-dependent epimerase/dehydratase family protein [Candidatus Angelobacter sp.]|nr:NAD-dependent epimerase/dehydratase family protein [Candidatus Angelobacter sp.]